MPIKADAEVTVPASKEGVSKKVKLDLEVDTSVKDLGPNPFAWVIHLARAVDAWRIFPRIFITTYIILLYYQSPILLQPPPSLSPHPTQTLSTTPFPQ